MYVCTTSSINTGGWQISISLSPRIHKILYTPAAVEPYVKTAGRATDCGSMVGSNRPPTAT